MRSPADVRALLRASYERHVTDWLVDEVPAARGIPLHPPSAAQARRDPRAVGTWVRAWREVETGAGATVAWETRRWSGYGAQELPVRLVVDDAPALARFAGRAADWQDLRRRFAELLEALGGDVPTRGSARPRDAEVSAALGRALRRHLTQWRTLTAADTGMVLRACRWFLDHPASGLQIRQLPIAGMNTKWLAPHRALVTDLVRAARGEQAEVDTDQLGPDPRRSELPGSELLDPLGLAPTPTFSDVVILDPALRIAGIRLLRLEQGELARLPVDPDVVLICENAETVQVLGDIPGVVAIHGGGYRGGMVAELAWVQRAPVLYWGDLDGHGFGVLHRVRSHHGDVTSVLMDSATLHRHRALWGHASRGAPMELSGLTAEESAVRRELADLGEVQLEQERIEITDAMQVLRTAVEAIRRR